MPQNIVAEIKLLPSPCQKLKAIENCVKLKRGFNVYMSSSFQKVLFRNFLERLIESVNRPIQKGNKHKNWENKHLETSRRLSITNSLENICQGLCK